MSFSLWKECVRFISGCVSEAVLGKKSSVVFHTSKKSLVPTKATKGSAGYDLFADIGAPMLIMPGTSTAVPTGVFLDVPEGYEVQIRSRSGIARKHVTWLTNGIGTIDSDYEDEVMVLLYNGGQDPFRIEPGDRIAQMVIAKLPDIEVVGGFVSDEQRTGGFGSTGVK